jgi:lysophospholipase L1-like esterase
MRSRPISFVLAACAVFAACSSSSGSAPSGGGGSSTGGSPGGQGGTAVGASGGSSGDGGSATGSGGTTGNGGATDATPWVGTWTAAPQLTESQNNPPSALSNSTLRQVIHASLGGSRIRVRFSNEFSKSALAINKAHVAVCRATPLVDSTIDTATDTALTFSGKESVTVAAGQAVWSDPLDFALVPLGNLTVTIAYGSAPAQGDVTGHPGSRTTSYQVVDSSDVGVASMTSAKKTDHWYSLSGVDVVADSSTSAVVAVGDSITDGKGSENGPGNNNKRWPDDLAVRLAGNATTKYVAVLNQGIGGNAVASGGLGPTLIDRFTRDVLGQSGVRWIIVLEGVNDIGSNNAPASTITAAFDSLIALAHARNLLIYGATITPFGGNSYYSAARESVRQEVNSYIRTPGNFDAYIDMDAAVTDGGNPPKLKSTYDGGDGLHPSIYGHQKMADTVDLTLFSR